jgi:hypothetical protein
MIAIYKQSSEWHTSTMDMNGAFEDEGKTSLSGKFTFKTKIIGLVLAAVLPLGYTLAANINLGTNSAIEFGQGVLTTTSCDDQISVNPGATFDNQGSKAFGVDSLVISDVSNSCIGKVFTLNFYGETFTAPSNSYGPITLAFIDSGTAGLHFELVGDYSTPAIIGNVTLDTLTAGLGTLGTTTYKGKSSVTLNQILSSRFSGFYIDEAHKVTLQSNDLPSIQSVPMSDNFVQSCLILSASNITDLNNHTQKSNSKVDNMLALADYGDEAAAMFADFSPQVKAKRAPEFRQLSVSARRITAFIDVQLPLCQAHLTALRNAQTDSDKIDALNESLSSISDAIDAERAADNAFAFLATSVNPYL